MSRTRATADSWKTKPMPPQQKELPLDGSYSRQEYTQMSLGFVPQSPQDKWFIYMKGEWLNFHRSATGTCIFRLQLVPEGDEYRAVKTIVNRNPQQYKNDDDRYDVELTSFLVDRLLLGRFAPFPHPRSISEDDYGRHKQHVMGQGADTDTISLPIRNGNHEQEE